MHKMKVLVVLLLTLVAADIGLRAWANFASEPHSGECVYYRQAVNCRIPLEPGRFDYKIRVRVLSEELGTSRPDRSKGMTETQVAAITGDRDFTTVSAEEVFLFPIPASKSDDHFNLAVYRVDGSAHVEADSESGSVRHAVSVASPSGGCGPAFFELKAESPTPAEYYQFGTGLTRQWQGDSMLLGEVLVGGDRTLSRAQFILERAPK